MGGHAGVNVPSVASLDSSVVSLGPGVSDGPEAVLETFSWSHDQQSVQLSPISSHLQDAGQGRASPQVGDITHPLSCVLVVIVGVVSIRSTEELPEPASILVGHAETLLPLLSLLGLYKDQTPPTASNYHAQHGKRPDLWNPRQAAGRFGLLSPSSSSLSSSTQKPSVQGCFYPRLDGITLLLLVQVQVGSV